MRTQTHKSELIFDLSEVIISGLAGAERAIGQRFGRDPAKVIAVFSRPILNDLLHGRISEDQYLADSLAALELPDAIDEVKILVRRNFHEEVPGMVRLINEFAASRRLALISDHAREWIGYIEANHPFLERFYRRFYSFELGSTKENPNTFRRALAELNKNPAECLLIDDNPENLAVAASVGLEGILFTGEAALRIELQRRGITIGSTREVA